MLITKTPDNTFKTNFSSFGIVGFHGTSILADKDIQAYGFLPKKVFTHSEHQIILDIGSSLNIWLSGYSEWLEMKSVSFANKPEGAIFQMKKFNGGQGLNGMSDVLNKIVLQGSDDQANIAKGYLEKISVLKTSQPVVYAVDLSQFDKRISRDFSTYHYQFDPSQSIPLQSPISPSLIIERLDLM